MTVYTFSQRFWQFIALGSLMLVSQSLLAADHQSKDLQQINPDNLPQLISQVSEDYYQQLESLINFYQLYHQKRDPRGFNVWHLRGFSPAFNERRDYYQALLADATPSSQPAAEETIGIFNALGTISTQLMIAFRDSDADAYQQAKSLVSDNNALLSEKLKEIDCDSEIRQIDLN